MNVRVLILTNLYPPNAMGGYELSCRDVVDRWRECGHEVTVLTTAGTIEGVVEPPAPEQHVRRELEWYWEAHVFRKPKWCERRRLEEHNQQRLRAALRDLRPQVVSVWHMGGMSLSLLRSVEEAGVPLVCNVCDEWPTYAPVVDAWANTWRRWPRQLRWLGARVTHLSTDLPELDRHPATFVSAYTLASVRNRSRWDFPLATVVGSGVDGNDFPAARAGGASPWDWRLLAVGRIEPRKGFDVAISALSELPPSTRLRIAGVADPAYLSELTALAHRLGVSDRLVIEAAPRSELRDLYARADAVLFTSRWEEPFGLVPLEAMTQSTPVIATRRGGSAEFLEDRVNCLEVPVDDPTALAAAVRTLSADPSLRSSLVSNGLLTAARFTTAGLAERIGAVHLAAVDLPTGAR